MICSETFACSARNGLSAAAGLRDVGHAGSQRLHALHPWVPVGEDRVAEPERVQGLGQVRRRLVGERAHEGLHEGAVDREVQFRQPRHSGEGAVILGAVAPSARMSSNERASKRAIQSPVMKPAAGTFAGRGEMTIS